MTPRSPKQQHPKTTTISRRLRKRADQHISIQSQELPRLRGARPRRAATLPISRHGPIDHQPLELHQHPLVWETEEGAKDHHPSVASNPTRIVEDQPVDILLAQTLDFGAYESAQSARLNLASTTVPHTAQKYGHLHTSASETSLLPLPSVSESVDFDFPLSADSQQLHSSFIDLQDMSTLGFMMAPSQYGMHHYGSSPSYPQNYTPTSQHGYSVHRSSTSGPYDSSYASSSALHHEQRRAEEHLVLPPYQAQAQPQSRSPYQQQQPMRSNSTPLASTTHGYSYPASQNHIPSQPLGSNASNYPPPQLYPPATYSASEYHPLPTMYPPSSTTPAAYPSYGSPAGIVQPPGSEIPPLSSSPGAQSNAVMPRILNSRPKPQCWEHGCNGRQFSTFSNLLRHQREKSGTASKSYCPRCGAEFTRTTARNGHMAHDKCKPRRPSESSH